MDILSITSDPTAQMIALSGLTTGFVQLVKTANFLNERFIPLLSFLVGCAVGWAFGQGASSILIGLVASGAWSGTRTLLNK